MFYNYTVLLQSKHSRPRKFKMRARSLNEVMDKLKATRTSYQIKSIVRKPA